MGKLSHRELRRSFSPSLPPPLEPGPRVERRRGVKEDTASHPFLRLGGPAGTHIPLSTRLQEGAGRNQPCASDLKAGQGPRKRAIPKSLLGSAVCRRGGAQARGCSKSPELWRSRSWEREIGEKPETGEPCRAPELRRGWGPREIQPHRPGERGRGRGRLEPEEPGNLLESWGSSQ